MKVSQQFSESTCVSCWTVLHLNLSRCYVLAT